jgi:hypothetical protein
MTTKRVNLRTKERMGRGLDLQSTGQKQNGETETSVGSLLGTGTVIRTTSHNGREVTTHYQVEGRPLSQGNPIFKSTS